MSNGEGLAEAFDPCAESPVTHRFVERLGGASPSLRSLIHNCDEMYRYNLASLKGSRSCAAILYYSKGWQIFQTIRNVASWRFGGLSGVASLLDFASGHGRVTRFLLREIDAARVRVCDICPEAVAFQKACFGVGGMCSTGDPLAFRTDRQFSMVIAASFFSHMPGDSFEGWMAALLRCVEPGGVLVFSTLGSELLIEKEGDRSEGIVFLPDSETKRLEKSAYGTAYVTEDFVRETIRRAGGGSWAVARFPRGLCGLQDLYVVASPDAPSFAALEPTCFPWGDADVYELGSDATLSVAGWLGGRQQWPPVRRVELLINNRLLDRCEPQSIRPGPLRWSFHMDSRQIDPDDVLMINAVTEKGLENIVALGTVATHPPARPAALATKPNRQAGFTLVAVAIGIAILTILIAGIVPSVATIMKRDREEELIFRGRQYSRAIILFQRRFGRYPNELKELYENHPRSIRKPWKDPMCDCPFHPLIQGSPESIAGGPITAPGAPAAPAPTPSPTPSDFGFGTGEAKIVGPIVGVRSTVHKEGLRQWRNAKFYDQWAFIVGDADRDDLAGQAPLPPGAPVYPTQPPK